MVGTFLKRGAIVDLIKSEERTNAIRKRDGLTMHPIRATVCGCPDQGRRIEEVLWVDGPKLYKVTYAPNLQTVRYGMMKANTAVSAFALATELR